MFNARRIDRIEAGPNTKNVPGGAIYQSFPSEYEACRVFEAAKQRGEVKAHPNAGEKDEATERLKNESLSPLGEEAALLTMPLDLKVDTESIGLQKMLSSPVHSRVARLRQTLRDPADPLSTSSSPPTNVTQVHAPLYEDDDMPCSAPVARPSPHFTFISGSSRAYPDVSDEYLLELGNEEIPFQLEVSDGDSSSPALSSSDSHPAAEEHTSKSPRCTPLHPELPPRSKGVEYRRFGALADVESVDSRIWLPKSRVFDPDKVKPRPLTRPPSPAKREASPVTSHEIVGDDPQFRWEILLEHTPFVKARRGRHSRLTPSWSLPVLSNQEREYNYSGFGSHPTQLLESHCTGKAKGTDCSVPDKHLAERLTKCSPSPGSHVQLVSRDGGDEQSTIVVHCPPNCLHETCCHGPVASSVPTIEPTSSRYVDACVSPITITSRIQDRDSPTKIRPKWHLDGGHPCELAGFTHVSQKGIGPEADVRSPIVRGAMVPMNAAE